MTMTFTLESLKSAADRVPARARIALGLVLLLVAALLAAVSLGIMPSERQAIVAGRANLCEAAAVQCSAYIGRGEINKLRGSFEPMLRRDEDVLSAGIRRADGSLALEFGNHAGQWFGANSTEALNSRLIVPIWSGNTRWGELEVRFRPLGRGGFIGFLMQPQMRTIGFAAVVCFVLYLIYLRKMLQHLDPSKVVPPRVRSALDTLAEGLIVLDNEQRIVLANQAFAAIVGRSSEELLGVHVNHLPWGAAGGSAKGEQRPWETAIRENAASRGVMMRLRDAQANLRTFSVNCSPVLADEGKSRGVLVSLDDVTRLEQNEVELRKSKEEAEQANRAKSDFLARMSHEIRTPMNAILGFADILRRGYAQDEAERREYVETIYSSGQHLLELINDILDLSKIEAGKLEVERSRCSPHRLIREVVDVLSVRAAQKGIALAFEWAGSAPETIETDPTRLRQALTNLVGNAIKFTEAGGVRVVARLVPHPRSPKLSIDVIDTGVGIRPEVLGRIFEPFAQADTSITRRFGGTGLGLSISRQIAEALGGGIRVASEFGNGSTFTLTVRVGSLEGVAMLDPASIEDIPQSQSHDAEPPLRLPGLRVLLAEDGASNRKLIELVLTRAGATLDCAEDGQTAVELALAREYDLIVMDMQMPVMDGYTAAAELRRRGVQAPTLALTAHAMSGDEEKCRSAGCSGFLTKPVNMDVLLRAIAEATRAMQASGASAVRKDRVPCGPLIHSTLPGEDPEFGEIIQEFVDRLRSQVNAIADAWAKGDLAELASLAHWVKGSGGTAGFPVLTDPARALEQAARENRVDEITASISRLQDLTARVAPPPNPVSTQDRPVSMSEGGAVPITQRFDDDRKPSTGCPGA
jgi:PAS domain S-box-containing protein